MPQVTKPARVAFVVGQEFGSVERREHAAACIHELDAVKPGIKMIIADDIPSALHFLEDYEQGCGKVLVIMSECAQSRVQDIVAGHPSLRVWPAARQQVRSADVARIVA